MTHRAMEAFYRDPDEHRRWRDEMADAGLYPTEEALLSRHLPAGSRVLNIGCGGGREALAMAKLGWRVTAVDLETGFVEALRSRAQARGLAVDASVMDALKLDFAERSFDAVVMVGQLIGHIRGRENRLRALAEAWRVTRRGGVGLFSTNAIEADWRFGAYFRLVNLGRRLYNPHGLEPDDAYVFRVGARRRSWFPDPSAPVFHWYRAEAFRADLRAAGWSPATVLRRGEFERMDAASRVRAGGETFHVAVKETD